MPIDRESILKRAEKLLRQGRLDAAIADYGQVVAEYPADWATANLLGDLYVRAGQVGAASQQYTRIAEHLAAEGFTAKAAALFKKVIKLNPADEHALLRAAELAAAQSLTADVRAFMSTLTQLRLRRGDRDGVIALARARIAFDPADVVGRLDAARMLAEAGDAAAAAGELRTAAASLESLGRTADAIRAWREAARLMPDDTAAGDALVRLLVGQGDVAAAAAAAQTPAQLRHLADACRLQGFDAAARDAMARLAEADPGDGAARVDLARRALETGDLDGAVSWAAVDGVTEQPDLALVLAEAYLRLARIDEGQTLLVEVLSRDPQQADCVEALARSLQRNDADIAASALFVVIDADLDRGDAAIANRRLEAFCSEASDAVSALRRHIEVCVDGGFETDLRTAQLRLADALVRREDWVGARGIVEDLLAADPADAGYRERHARIARALGLPELTDAEGDGAGDTVAPDARWPGGDIGTEGDEPSDHDDLAQLVASLEADGGVVHREMPAPRADAVGRPDVDDALPPPAPARPAIPQTGRATPNMLMVDDALLRLFEEGESPRPAAADDAAVEIDLSGELQTLQGLADVPAAPADTVAEVETDGGTLDDYFEGLRHQAAADRIDEARCLMSDGAAAFRDGRFEEASRHYRTAARDVSCRWDASRALAAIAREQGDLHEAIEWLERAAETPAASLVLSHELLYELGETLLAAREDARALAVFLELHAADPGFRDVADRVARMTHEGQPGAGTGGTR